MNAEAGKQGKIVVGVDGSASSLDAVSLDFSRD